MTRLSKMLASASLSACALAAAVASPAAAQVDGRLATADISRAILGTNALQTAYQQIGTTYSAQIEQRQTKQQQLTDLLQPFDSNSNGQLDDSELPAVQSSASFTQIQTLEQEVAAITNQVNAARVYAVEQILAQYPTALTDVTTHHRAQREGAFGPDRAAGRLPAEPKRRADFPGNPADAAHRAADPAAAGRAAGPAAAARRPLSATNNG